MQQRRTITKKGFLPISDGKNDVFIREEKGMEIPSVILNKQRAD